MTSRYVPQAGDIVWLQFDSQAGHEQSGRRPAVVLSPARYNEKTGLMLCCPLTTKRKNYPFEVAIADERRSAVLSDQVKSLDWVARDAQRKGKVSASELSEIRRKAINLIGRP